MRLNKITLAVSIATLSHSAYAQINSVTTLGEVTVSASPIHAHQAFEVPSQINRLAGSEKRARDSGSLGEVLEAIPGVNNMSAGTQSGKPVIRGLTGNRVKVLSNGQSTDYQAYGTRHLPNTDSYLAESIEVIRGPQSVLYGSEALGGVVNVMHAPVPYGQGVKGELATEYNSNNHETLLGVKVGAGSEHFGITMGVVNRDGDNFTVPDVSTAVFGQASDKPLFVGEVPYTNFDNESATFGVGYQDNWGLVELRHTQWVSKQNYLGYAIENDQYVAVPAGQKLQNDETQLKAEFELEGDWLLKPSWTHTRNAREASHDLPYETMAADKESEEYLDLLVKRDDIKLALEHPEIGGFEGEMGIELSEKAQVLRSGHLAPTADISQRAIYLFEEADYNKWLVQFGLRYDWQSVSAPLDGNNIHFVEEGVFSAANNSRDFEVMTGSLGATYRLDSQWSVAGNVARGFRAPSIFELYAGGEHGGVQAYQIGNPDLEAETALNTDLSLRWQADKTQMVATLYQNWINNYIYLANELEADGSVKVTRNEADTADIPVMKAQQTDAQIHGFEFSLNHQWSKKWSSAAALEILAGRDTQNSQALPLMPANNLRLAMRYQPDDLGSLQQQRWSLGVKMVDSQDAAGAYEPFSQFDTLPFGTASTQAYSLWNLGYQTQLKLDKQTLYLAGAVENLFDTAYVDFLDTYKGYTLGQGRNFKLSARLTF